MIVFFSVCLMVRISVGCVMFGVMCVGFVVVSVAIMAVSMCVAWCEKFVTNLVISKVGENSILDITSENSLL